MGEESTEVVLVGEEGGVSAEVAIASSVLPYDREDNKYLFLSFRSCGLSITEARNAVGVSKSALEKWRRTDPQFKDLCQRIPEFRVKVAAEFLSTEYLRNLLLFLQRDKNVIRKALAIDREAEEIKDPDNRTLSFTKEEADYLKKIRGQYTPEQLQTLQALFKDSDSEKFNWAKTVASRSRDKVRLTRTETVEFGGKDKAESDN